MAKQRIRKKTKRKTQKKTRSNSKSKTQRKTYRLRNKSKKKYRKRGGARTEHTKKKTALTVFDRTKKLPKFLQYKILNSSHPSVATGMYNNSRQRQELNRRIAQLRRFGQGVRNRIFQRYVDRTANLPKFLQHKILNSSHPSVATGMYNGPQRQGLNRRTAQLRRLGQGVRNRMTTQVALPGIPVGTLIRAAEILDIEPVNTLDDAQKKEVRRLYARLYTNHVDGYSDESIFGTGPFNSKTAAAHVGTHAQRKQQRQALLATGNINDMKINGESLPLPLRILRKNRMWNTPLSERYPRRADGTIDETNDIFWPRNRREFDLYMKNIPNLDEIVIYGW